MIGLHRHIRLAMALTFLIALTGCKREEPVYNTRFVAFGALVDLSIIGVDRDTAQRASRVIEQDFAAMDATWYSSEPGTLSRVNELLATGKPFAAPPSVLPLIRLGQDLAARSGDLFNPAVGRLVTLWGFHLDTPECRPPPPKEQIRALVEKAPRMSDISLDGITVQTQNPSIQLHFGSLGKGYGVDMAVAHLREMGIHNAIVNVGGDLRAIGDRDGQPWRITIRRPTGTGVLAMLDVSGDESVFTAGDYERNFVFDGRNYHHLLDPRTGYPAEGTHSVTVVHGNAVTADAAAAALFVAGPEHWYRVARDMGVRYALLMDTSGTIHMTPAMAKRLKFLDKDPDIRLSDPL